MNFFEIPIFIISYNRLDDLKKIVLRLKQDGYSNINIIDNASTDEELLSYLNSLDDKVYFMDRNYGHRVLWESGKFNDIILNNYYVLTDPDIIPVEVCPADYIERFFYVLNTYQDYTKVGFSLKIDDLPDEYVYKYDIIRFESFYWEKRISNDSDLILYEAPLDTTFALYRPGKIDEKNFYNGIRVGKPYVARHLGWYTTYDDMTEKEKKYYLDYKNNKSSTTHNKEFINRFSADIITRLANDKEIDFYKLMRAITTPKYLSKNAKFSSIVKSYFYIVAKKILYMCKL